MSASWDYLLLAQSITLSDWICHLSKCPEAVFFVCNKSPSEGPICLLFSLIPATFLSCTLFCHGFTLIVSDWIVHLLCTYLLRVFTILRRFFISPPKNKYFVCLTYWVCTKDFLLYNYSYHKLDILLAAGRVALKHLGFFNYWFKWIFASQKCSHDDILGEVLCWCHHLLLCAYVLSWQGGNSVPYPGCGWCWWGLWLMGVPWAEVVCWMGLQGNGKGEASQYKPLSVLPVKSWGRPWTKISLPVAFGGALTKPTYTVYLQVKCCKGIHLEYLLSFLGASILKATWKILWRLTLLNFKQSHVSQWLGEVCAEVLGALSHSY